MHHPSGTTGIYNKHLPCRAVAAGSSLRGEVQLLKGALATTKISNFP
jgi:hypothetical protein